MSEQRKYSVTEIDEMRLSIAHIYYFGETYDGRERTADIENRLRTYMLNGTDPEELKAVAEENIKSYHRNNEGDSTPARRRSYLPDPREF